MRALARLGSFRARAESRMTSTVTIRREPPPGTPPVIVNGFEQLAWVTVATDVPFRLIRGEGFRVVHIGSSDQSVAARDGDLPVGTPLQDDDYLDITTGENAGHVVRVLESIGADQRKSLRVPVVEVQRPEEW